MAIALLRFAVPALLLISLSLSPAQAVDWRHPLRAIFPSAFSSSPLQMMNIDGLSLTADDNDVFIPFQARQIEPSPVPTMTGTATATPTPSLSITPTISQTPSASMSFLSSPSHTPTVSPSAPVSTTPSATISASASTTLGSASATPSTSNPIIVGPGQPGGPSVSPSPSISAKTNKPGKPDVCSGQMDPNFGMECGKVVDRRRLKNLGKHAKVLLGIRVRIWTQNDKFRWRVNSLNGKKLRIYKMAVFITTRQNPSTRTINNRELEVFKPRQRAVGRIQVDSIRLMPNRSRGKTGCCGTKAKAYVNIVVCRGKVGACFKRRDIVINFNIKCKRICKRGRNGTPAKMSATRRCPRCL